MHSSIVRSVTTSFGRQGGSAGHVANLAVKYSNYDPAVASSGAGTLSEGPGNSTALPRFVDPATGDFHLRAASPAIDAGKPGPGGFPLDLDGGPRRVSKTRTCARRRDMGAYEFRPPSRPPIASAHADRASAPLGAQSLFRATGSCDPDSDALTEYHWEFDDGTNANGFNVLHQFTTRGTHHANLTVLDSTFRIDSATATVTITAARPCVNGIGGTNAGETIRGTRFGDRISGFAGDDVLKGLGRGDCLDGGRGADKLFGGGGNDVLRGGRARDVYTGGRGNDKLLAADGVAEDVDCGAGTHDRARADRADTVRRCESVTRVP
jgi:Ca2+-binding RTX toxin-like protein